MGILGMGTSSEGTKLDGPMIIYGDSYRHQSTMVVIMKDSRTGSSLTTFVVDEIDMAKDSLEVGGRQTQCPHM